ncbi:polysaccharide deacetylase family protein [Owenweeksia hongkongensis]|uniref:polysaccharide deacetylase family protein n=1 Tax=Owenweeksia hongkongensis TaxID=253245 RepID=UPI003A8CE5D4
MRNYLIKSPWWLKAFYSNLTWNMSTDEKIVYITFDDGPTPEITEWVMEQLAKHQALGTFFLIGKNVVENPKIYQQLKDSGHSIGNHTLNHLNGWKHTSSDYVNNVKVCQDLLHPTTLFRPPYGRIKRKQAQILNKAYNIIMWDILSGDFDTSIDGERCYQNVVKHIQPGSIIVFHDSLKAWPRLQIALPKTLEYLKEKGFRMEAL